MSEWGRRTPADVATGTRGTVDVVAALAALPSELSRDDERSDRRLKSAHTILDTHLIVSSSHPTSSVPLSPLVTAPCSDDSVTPVITSHVSIRSGCHQRRSHGSTFRNPISPRPGGFHSLTFALNAPNPIFVEKLAQKWVWR
ncbi:hypothetical protein MVEN_00170900 [Mycena venus]|uniref:Uncharacterized protein n=1 Tax=Mycena venus TaxID=2733690 RepID=A0A8H6Z0A4_9AGAR|nr:hypothetical protein MVEN_00170900 [Mycena venus]